jgi:phasin
MTDKQFEIPDTVREMAERNVEQARAAYVQFVDMAREAQDAVSKSSEAMAKTARDIQVQALRLAEQNIDASFQFAADLARARDLKEYMEVQTRYAQRQMKTYSEQAQDLGRMLADLGQNAQKGSKR